MCSINLIYGPLSSSTTLKSSIKKMAQETTHRGPDSTNYIRDKNLVLAINRLQIVGGLKGQQPILDEKRNLILMCNGEIFNYKELKTKYLKFHRFTTTSDVEVILHMYEEFGEKCINYLEGQFAFALYNKSKQQIIIARDQYGILPLFYSIHNDFFIASSEIKAIVKSDIFKNIEFDEMGLAETILFYGPIRPRTTFKNINQLEPGKYGVYNMGKNDYKEYTYWSLEIATEKPKKKLDSLLKESVKKRLQGDYPPGVYVSGGLDSSIIAYLTKICTPKKTLLFGIVFRDGEFNESKYQKLLAKTLRLKLIQVNISDKDIIDNLDACVYHVEAPLTRLAPVPMLILSNSVKNNGLKYVLCGEGADELFLGYPVFLKDKSSYENKWDNNILLLKFFKNKNLIKNLTKIKKDSDKFNNKTLSKDKKIRIKEIRTKLSSYLLSNQGDRVAMANSVEQRFPFLDTKIADFAFSLKYEDLIKNNTGKYILKKYFKDRLPRDIIARDKQGFLAPDKFVIKKLLSNSKYKSLLRRKIIDQVGIFDSLEIKKMLQKIKSQKSLPDEYIQAIIFIITTHLLYQFFVEHKLNKRIKYLN